MKYNLFSCSLFFAVATSLRNSPQDGARGDELTDSEAMKVLLSFTATHRYFDYMISKFALNDQHCHTLLFLCLSVRGAWEIYILVSLDETDRLCRAAPCLHTLSLSSCVCVCCWLKSMHLRKATLRHKTGCCPRAINKINWAKTVFLFVMLQVQRFGTPCVKKQLDWSENWGWALLKILTVPWCTLFFLSLLHYKKLT